MGEGQGSVLCHVTVTWRVRIGDSLLKSLDM